MNNKKFSDLCPKAKRNVLYAFFSTLIGICFILLYFFNISLLSVLIGLFLAIIGLVQIIYVMKNRKDPPEDDSVLGITFMTIGLLMVMPGINNSIFMLLPALISLFGLGILIETLFRIIFKKKKKDRDTSVVLKFVVSLLLIAIGVVFFLVESFNAYISLVTGIIFIGFSLYGGIRSLSIEPESEPEKIPDYE